MRLKEELTVKQLKRMAIELCCMYGNFCEIANCEENFDDLCEGMSPTDVAKAVFYGDFHIARDLHRFNDKGNIQSLYEWELEKEIIDSERDIRDDYMRMITTGSYDDFGLREEVLEEEECTEF